MRVHLWLVPLVGLLLAADAKEDVAKEIKKLEGTWIVERFEANGKDREKDKGLEFVVTAEKMGPKKEGGKWDAIEYTVDPSKKPKTIDLGKGDKMLPGIYELDGDTLKICFDEEGKARPTEFVSKAGSGQRLIVVKRQKK